MSADNPIGLSKEQNAKPKSAKADNREGWHMQMLREMLGDKDEKARLFAVAKLEEHFYEYFGPRDYAKLLVDIARNDDSQVVRAMALRALYHESSECWPFQPEDRKLVYDAIEEIKERRDASERTTLDQNVAGNLHRCEMERPILDKRERRPSRSDCKCCG